MFKLKQAFLCSTIVLSFFTLSMSANANESQETSTNTTNTDTTQTANTNTANQNKPATNPLNHPHLGIGAYLELGGNFNFIDMFNAKSDTEEVSIGKSANFTGGFGVRFNTFSIGMDVAILSPNVNFKYTGLGHTVVTAIDNAIDGTDVNTVGYLDTNIVLFKFSRELLISDHASMSLNIGLGAAAYTVHDSKENVRYSPVYINPAVMGGVDFRLYLGKDRGLYLSAGARYTHIFQKELVIDTLLSSHTLTGGLGTAQGIVKIGYQF